jgi:hypothetical protein
MADPIAVIIRFSGDPDELLARFESARQAWIAAQDEDHERPVFYAACKTSEGVAILNVWRSAPEHRAFGEGLHAQIHGMGIEPAEIDRLRIAKLGWD